MKALSVRQPWAWLIINGHKDIENRNWRTHYRGPLLIHAAGADADRDAWRYAERLCRRLDIALPERDALQRGGIVGRVELVDCVEKSKSPWFGGRYGFVLQRAHRSRFRPLKGRLGIFEA